MITKKLDYTFFISLILLIIAILINTWVYSYNYYTNKNIDDLKSKIEESKKAISNIKNNERIKTYFLLEQNKNNIVILDKKSNIISYIEHLKVIKSKYYLNFTWFNYTDLKITTNAWVENKDFNSLWNNSLAYIKVTNFIEKYRMDKESKFKLPFINVINWQSEIKFDINFEVK